MNQNACKHLGGVVKDYKKFNVDFQHCIYAIEEEDEFISAWGGMLDKYGLHENEWLKRWIEKKGALGTSVWQKYVPCPNDYYPKK
jgi:zinc finger SWIM domain-containing protein 3